MSNQAGAVVDRTNYDPYGGAINKTVDGVGYTGHVMDPVTGLTYMQQRYYDPVIGRFLSVDPVTALDNGDMRHFNRYAYGFNNPYKFTDPDGRVPSALRDHREAERHSEGATPGPEQAGYRNPTGGKMRGCDSMGCGNDGAPRGKRVHLGADYESTPGQDVVSPTDAKVERRSNPYASDPTYKGLLLKATDGNSVQIWYVDPDAGVVGTDVVEGQKLGTAQDIQAKHGSGMTNHVHVRITDPAGKNIDPATLIDEPTP